MAEVANPAPKQPPGIQDPVRTGGKLSIEQLLLLTESALDKEVVSDIGAGLFRYRRIRGALAIELGVGGAISFFAPIRWYIDTRDRVLAIPGRAAAGAARRLLPNGGYDFCKAVRYCQNKSRFGDLVGALNGLEFEVPVAQEIAENNIGRIGGIPEEVQTVIDLLLDASDFVIPLSLIVKILKFGLDDLCPCCVQCGGTGFVEGGVTCDACDGTGQARPRLP